MRRYLLKKAGEIVPVLIGVTVIAFLLLKFAPGDPLYAIIGERISKDRFEQLKLNESNSPSSFIKQYGMYAAGIIKGNFGVSYITRQPVMKEYVKRFPNTFRLAVISVAFAIITGIAVGIIASVAKCQWIRIVFAFFATAGISTPVFWFGLLLIFIFSRMLHVVPASGMGDGKMIYIVLPAVTLGSRSAAYIARMTQSCMDDIMHSAYINAVRARGIRPLPVVLKHALKNALIPIITLIGLDFGSYLNGSVLTETIFGWNGVGRYLVYAITQRDYPVIMGGVVLGAAFFIVINIVIDICYVYVDPRIELK
ncbi:MAG: ABC transporter permease [bacterium]|nr:ABC transporter permease [bacterium]